MAAKPKTETAPVEPDTTDAEYEAIFGSPPISPIADVETPISPSSIADVPVEDFGTPGGRPDRADRAQHAGMQTLGIQAGKKMYTYRNVLNEAHRHGFMGFAQLHPPMIFTNQSGVITAAVCSVSARFSDGSVWEGVGDCDDANGGKVAGGAKPRMADTRAKARALGDAMNLDANFSEEMIDGDPEASVSFTPRTQVSTPSPAKFASPTGGVTQGDARWYRDDRLPDAPSNDGTGGWECAVCHEPIEDSEKYSAHKKAQWAIRDYGEVRCWNHGKGATS